MNTNNLPTLQFSFLSSLQNNNTGISIYLVNGIKLQGTIQEFDNESIVLNNHSTSQMVYKHAISTIVPSCK